ncbi:MAG: DUF615 domain-containing protein [Methylococcales bacterium]|nr:DUF615 domain-containing protein [Methylococcales bacterium]
MKKNESDQIDHDNDQNNEYDTASKSQLKREVEALQKLGVKLTELPVTVLNSFEMEDKLRSAVLFAKTIKSNGAKRRHMQYIGKLMRNFDSANISQQFENYTHHQSAQVDHFHQLELWRDRLIKEGDSAINELLNQYSQYDRTQLRQLIRNAKKELKLEQPPKNARQLFKYLKKLS